MNALMSLEVLESIGGRDEPTTFHVLATLKQCCRTYTKEKMAAGKLLPEIWELRMGG